MVDFPDGVMEDQSITVEQRGEVVMLVWCWYSVVVVCGDGGGDECVHVLCCCGVW